MNELKLVNVSAQLYAKLPNRKSMLDHVNNFSYTFSGGKIYKLVGEFGDGGASISYLITGNISDVSGIAFNNRTVDIRDLKRICSLLDDNISKNINIFMRNTPVIKLLQDEIKKKNSPVSDVNKILEIFGLSNERVQRPISKMGEERYRASLAIDYVQGKLIFCFPWYNSTFLRGYVLNEKLISVLKFLREQGFIIIIPCSEYDPFIPFSDERLYLKYWSFKETLKESIKDNLPKLTIQQKKMEDNLEQFIIKCIEYMKFNNIVDKEDFIQDIYYLSDRFLLNKVTEHQVKKLIDSLYQFYIEKSGII
ncbi:hypothetical protein ACFFK0_01385 [Paenibacillus chartarius]|uniref:Uncharacterized protein n=1 Tax=Paenibacillus chartarius TaxID=747481 RepID=A0ABV6DEN2_9BACL